MRDEADERVKLAQAEATRIFDEKIQDERTRAEDKEAKMEALADKLRLEAAT